jgi:transcriptional regulatory protein RtcR
MPRRQLVVIGFLGTTLDAGRGSTRWDRWRPTVALTQHEDLLVHRLELLHGAASADLARTVVRDINHASPETLVKQHPFELPDPWDFEGVYAALQDFATGYPFDPEHEDYLVHITTGTHVVQICLFLLTEARYLPARLLQTSPGARSKGGAGTYSIIDLDLSKYDRLASRAQKEHAFAQSFLKAGIDTKNAAFNALMERIERVATSSRAPVLLTGPTGSGKSKLSRRIFELKKTRRQLKGEFAEVNCATLRGDAAMSALFGHTKGAFTGAVTDRPGLLKKAHQGVLFLDEIGELGLDEQAMLLRAIEEKVFYPMGSDRETSSDFQLICGTNRDLRARVAQGKFREDLLARIDTWTFRLPALHERPEDIAPNLEFELALASRSLSVNVTMSRQAKELFLALASTWMWPGNFRDLSAAVTRMATLAPGGRIDEASVMVEMERLKSATGRSGGRPPPAQLAARVLGEEPAARLDRFDRVQLEDVLGVCLSARSLSEAGRVLFAQSRTDRTSVNDADRLRKYLARFGLDLAAVRAAPSQKA